jgi:hypothetical protein
VSSTARNTLLILVAALVSMIVAIVTAWLVSCSGAPIQTCLLSAGAAFGGTTTLIILILDKAGALS